MIVATLLASLLAPSTPEDLRAVLSKAKPGDIVRLQARNYGQIAIRDRDWSPALTIDAGSATITLLLINVQGVDVVGGHFGPAMGPGPAGYAISIKNSSRISLHDPYVSKAVRGMVISASEAISIRRATLTGLVTDGINIGSSRDILIEDSKCSDFSPKPGDHPDCIQMWSRPNLPPTSDIVLRRNSATGDMQGFTGFNHVRNGIDDGGFDRISMINNHVIGTAPQGVAIYDCRACTISGNVTRAARGAKYRVSVNVTRCTNCRVKGNDIGPKPTK